MRTPPHIYRWLDNNLGAHRRWYSSGLAVYSGFFSGILCTGILDQYPCDRTYPRLPIYFRSRALWPLSPQLDEPHHPLWLDTPLPLSRPFTLTLSVALVLSRQSILTGYRFGFDRENVLALKFVGLVVERLTLPVVFYVTTLRVRFPNPE